MIEDMFEGQPVLSSGDGKDITKCWVDLHAVARIWDTTPAFARAALRSAPEGQGDEWLGEYTRVDSTGLSQKRPMVYVPGIFFLGTEVKNAKGARFIVHLCNVVLPQVLQQQQRPSNTPAVIETGGQANPFPAIRALVDEAETTRALSEKGVAESARAHDRIDDVVGDLKNPDRYLSARRHMQINKIDYRDILNERELEQVRIDINKRKVSKNDYMTAAARKIGGHCAAIARSRGIHDECKARAFDVGNYEGVNQYPPEVIEQAVRTIMGG